MSASANSPRWTAPAALACAALLVAGTLPAADPADPLSAWKSGVKVSAVVGGARHSVHSYYVACPESPDGRFVLFYASTHPKGYEGEIRVRERATGRETVLAREVVVEDAHRAA